MDKDLEVKYNNLKEYLKSLGSVAVAFSSGVDSTFLLKVAHDVLGDKAIAITLNAVAFPEKETNDARDFCKSEGIKHIICGYNPLDIEGFADNPPDRCYICKKVIYSEIKKLAKENNIAYVAEGSNMSDNGDYRPGLKAIEELKVESPLQKANLYKSETVSYTHLDVYKRQSFPLTMSGSNLMVMLFFNSSGFSMRSIFSNCFSRLSARL